MSETQSLSSRQAIRQTADLAPLSPRLYPVRLGQSWTYRSLTRQVAGGVVDESVATERERVAGVTPLVDASWSVSLDHEIEFADRTRERFATTLLVGERSVGEDDGPFLSVEPCWERRIEDGTIVRFEAIDGLSVTVPAGTFTDCREVHEVAQRDGEVLYERRDWYAPGVGRVQSRYERRSSLGSVTEERQLLSARAADD